MILHYCPNNKYMKCSGVYLIINTINHKFYIGSTINFYDRFKSHKSELYNNKHGNKYLQRSYNKYKSFIFVIIEMCENYREQEMYYIQKLNPDYNLIETTGSNFTHSLETRLILSKAKKGKKLSEYHRLKIKQNHNQHRTGKPFTEKEKSKMRKNMPQSIKVIINDVHYDSIKHASEQLDMCRNTLTNVITGKTKRGHNKIKSFKVIKDEN